MSNYEFWDELGKIFNAVVAYQEKTIEFNKRFINPWIRLGNVFDKQDRNEEAICAYQKAIEIDPNNAQNWYELGKSISGWKSMMKPWMTSTTPSTWILGLDRRTATWRSPSSHRAIRTGHPPLSQRHRNCSTRNKDRAVAWNRLGNLYRKLNEYELGDWSPSKRRMSSIRKTRASGITSMTFPMGRRWLKRTATERNRAIPVAPSLSDLVTADGQAADAVFRNTDETARCRMPRLKRQPSRTKPSQTIRNETPRAQDVSG